MKGKCTVYQAYLKDHLHRMQHEIEITTRKLELEKRRLAKLDEEVARARSEHDDATLPSKDKEGEDDKKKKKKNLTAGKTLSSVRGPIKALQNRLDTQTKKLDQVTSESKTLRDQVDQIRKERLQMNHVFKKLHDEVRENGSLIAGLSMEIDANKDVQCDAGQRIQVMKKKLDQERTSFKTEVLRLREEMKKQDREKKAFEVKLNQDNIGRHCKKDYLIADEEEDFSENNAMRRILKLAFLNCIQRRHIKQHHKTIEVFEQAFATIKSTTGISDIEEIVKIFVKLEEPEFLAADICKSAEQRDRVFGKATERSEGSGRKPFKPGGENEEKAPPSACRNREAARADQSNHCGW